MSPVEEAPTQLVHTLPVGDLGQGASRENAKGGAGLKGQADAPRKQKPLQVQGFSSGAEEGRTPDLVIANDALYQLSYRPGVGPKCSPR